MNARVYVSTYAKYAAGKLTGEWVELNDFTEVDEFLDHCASIHDDEETPEFMYQDFEGIPSHWYDELRIDPAIFEILQLHEYDQKRIGIIAEATGINPSEALESYEDYFVFRYEDRHEVFKELYPDAVKAAEECLYLKEDIDGWIRDNYTKVWYDDERYCVSY